MKLIDFVQDFVNLNALVRLWRKTEDGYEIIEENANKRKSHKVGMAWAILDHTGWQAQYADREVLGLPSIGVEEDTDAVNIFIRDWPEPGTMEEHDESQPTTTRAAILDEAKRCVCGGREQDYGTPEDSFGLIAELWGHYLKGAHRKLDPVIAPNELVTPKDVAIMMALLKIARIAGGDKADSFVDLAGYAACAGELAGGAVHE